MKSTVRRLRVLPHPVWCHGTTGRFYGLFAGEHLRAVVCCPDSGRLRGVPTYGWWHRHGYTTARVTRQQAADLLRNWRRYGSIHTPEDDAAVTRFLALSDQGARKDM